MNGRPQPNTVDGELHGIMIGSEVGQVDKITTVPKTKVGARIGRLDDEDILRLNHAAFVFLGLAVSPRAKPTT